MRLSLVPRISSFFNALLVFLLLTETAIAKNLICDDLFINSSQQVAPITKLLGRKPVNLMEAREDKLKIENRGSYNSPSWWGSRILRSILNFFTGKASENELEELFGKDWKRYLSRNEIVLRDLDLSDKQFRQVLSYIKKYSKNQRYIIDLHGNRRIKTATVLDLLRSGIHIIKLDLHDTRLNVIRVVEAIVESQPELKELTIDNVSDRALRILSQHKNLRKLDLDKAILGSSRVNRLRYEFNHIMAELMGFNMNRPNASATAVYEFGSFVTVSGIESFLAQQKRKIENRSGNITRYNPHFREISLPKIDSIATAELLLEKIAKYVYDEESPIKISFASYSEKFVITKIKDGDTLDILNLESPDQPEAELRLAYIDTFEKDDANETARKMGVAAYNFIKYHIDISKGYRRVTVGRRDKYGRLPTLLYLDIGGRWVLINRELYIYGLAVRYDSGEINKERNQEEQNISPEAWYKENKRTIDYWFKKNN